MTKQLTKQLTKSSNLSNIAALFNDLCTIITQARCQVATNANVTTTLMYWHIGKRINSEILDNQRAVYGKQIVSQVATQLSWSHFIELLPLKDSLQRDFYMTLSASERWGRNRLRAEIDGMLFERTAISNKPEETVRLALSKLRDSNVISPDLVFKSPYFLEFTGLTGMYSEKSLEDSLIANLEHFLIELGNGFCFYARQKRMIIDGEDFYLDLLFYHRRLHRLIAIDLKLGRFKAQYKGQMELYLRWLEQNEMEQGELPPLGLILCTEGSEEQIELLQLDKSGIRVAQYITELPPREVLCAQIRKSLETSKALMDNKEE